MPYDWAPRWQYALALGSMGLVLLVRWLLDPALRDSLQFLPAFAVLPPLVLLVRPAPFLAAAGLGWLGSVYLFVPERMSLQFAEGPGVVGSAALVAAIGLAAVTAWLSRRSLDARTRDAAALYESRRFLEEVVETSPALIVATDDQGRIVLFNRACEELTGYAAKEALGRSMSELFLAAEWQPIVAERFANLDAREVREPHVNPWRTKSGEERLIEWRCIPLPAGSGQPRQVLGAGIDITSRRRSEEALRRSHETFFNLIQNSPFGVYIIDSRFRLRQVSAGAQKVFQNVRPLLGRDFAEVLRGIWEEPFASQAIARFRHTLETGEPYVAVDTTEQRRDVAEIESYDWRIERITLPDGQFGVVCYFYDLSDRRRAEAELRNRGEQFQTLVDQAPLGVYLVDGEFRIRQVNPVAAPVFREFSGGVIGRDFEEVLRQMWTRARADEIVRVFRTTLETGEPYHVAEFADRRADRGVTEYYDWRIERIVLPDGRYGVVCYFRDISEQVRARLAIAASEKRYRTLFESMDEGFCVLEAILDDEGKAVDLELIEANPAFEKHTGLRVTAGLRMLELVPDIEPHWLETFARVVTTGAPERFINEAKPLGRWFDVYGFRVGEPQQRRVALLLTDITARQRADQALRDSEKRLRFTLEAADFGTWDLDLTTPPPHAATRSLRHDQIFGYQELRPEWTYELFLEHVLDEDRPLVESTFERARSAEGGDWEVECRIRRADGQVPWIWVRGRVLHDPTGQPQRMLGLVADITERKRAEDMLARELRDHKRLQEISCRLIPTEDVNTLYKGLIDAATEITEADCGTMQSLDRETGELCLLEAKGMSERVWERFARVSPDASTSCAEAVRRGERVVVDYATDARVAGTAEARAHLAEGIRSAQSTPLVARSGRVVGVFTTHWNHPHQLPERSAYLLDILARQAADLIERASAEEALRESDRRKDEFLATLAHELRNPLAAIRMAMHVMGSASHEPRRVDTMTAIVDRQSSQLVRLIEDLLDVSRISRGKIELRRGRVDVAEVVRSVVHDSRAMCDARGLELSAALPVQPVVVTADPVRFAQVVNNLLHNACKFTDRGGKVRVSVEREGEEAVVRVADTGIGMPREQLARVFDMFSQVESPLSRRAGGLGIGLSLARSIVELHGGKIEARSRGPGKGSEFLVRMPAIDGAAPDSGGAGERSGRAATERSVAAQRILAADDNRDALFAVALMLRMSGHEVQTAANGAEALEVAEAYRPDVALLDIGMPGVDGYEVARRIRQEPWGRGMLLVAMTGWGQERDKQQAEDAGFDAHLTKPVDVEVLERLLAARRTVTSPAAGSRPEQR
jgi:PAS domain S-box-containing protein